MYLYQIAIKVLEWLTILFFTGILLLLCVTIFGFTFAITEVWIKETFPRFYRWLQSKLYRD